MRRQTNQRRTREKVINQIRREESHTRQVVEAVEGRDTAGERPEDRHLAEARDSSEPEWVSFEPDRVSIGPQRKRILPERVGIESERVSIYSLNELACSLSGLAYSLNRISM